MKTLTLNYFPMTLLMLTLPGATGCRSFGPGSVLRDRSDYSAALSDSWKSMMLLNVVKTRYLDLPIFLDVGQVVSGYTLETGVSVNGQFAPQNRGDVYAAGGVHGIYVDRPTITYTPMTGDRFLQGFINPVAPARVFSLVQSGYAADFVLQLGLESLNGLRNQPITLGSKYQADPEFFQALKLLREIQDARAVGLRVEPPTNALPATVLFFHRERMTPDVEAKIVEVRRLLGLPPGATAFRLVQSPLPGGPGELSVDTRSLCQIMASLAIGVDVPPKHRERKLVPPMAEVLSPELLLLRVHSGPSKPSGAFVSVPYEGQWFWIASDDWKSKRTFASILFLFTLADIGPAQNMPTLTIPTR